MDTNSIPGDRESFEGPVVPNAGFDLSNYEANEDYFFIAYRLLSWFPVINVWGKTYYPEDIDPDVLATLTGSEVNIFHDASKIIGIVVDSAVTQDGLDVLIRLKRDAVKAQNLTVEDIVGLVNKCSLELRKEPELCSYLVLNDDLSVDRTIPAVAGFRSGMRPTTTNDPVPFYFRGNKRVVERVKPTRFTGVGLLNNPADKTALGYGIVASDDKPDNPVAPVQEPVGEPDENKDTLMELEKLQAELKEAQDKLALYETEKASAFGQVDALKAENSKLKTDLDAANTELASATEKASALQTEKDARTKTEKTAQIYDQFVAILAPESDEDKAKYQEKASAACDEHGIIREFSLDLREAKLAKAEADAKATSDKNAAAALSTNAAPLGQGNYPVTDAPKVNVAEPVNTPAKTDPKSNTESASAGTVPAVSIAPSYDGGASNTGVSSDDLLLLI